MKDSGFTSTTQLANRSDASKFRPIEQGNVDAVSFEVERVRWLFMHPLIDTESGIRAL